LIWYCGIITRRRRTINKGQSDDDFVHCGAVALLDTLRYNRLRFHGDAITNDLTFPFVVFCSAALHGLIRRSAFGAGFSHC
jgi:hypothetical protein